MGVYFFVYRNGIPRCAFFTGRTGILGGALSGGMFSRGYFPRELFSVGVFSEGRYFLRMSNLQGGINAKKRQLDGDQHAFNPIED